MSIDKELCVETILHPNYNLANRTGTSTRSSPRNKVVNGNVWCHFPFSHASLQEVVCFTS